MVGRTKSVHILLVAGMLGTLGCGQQGGAPPAGTPGEPDISGAAVEVAVTPEMAEKLAAADALDGEADKIVTLCASCALGMDGLSEHRLRVGEYTMYFCAEHCKQAFAEDVSKSVLAMEIPEADASDSP